MEVMACLEGQSDKHFSSAFSKEYHLRMKHEVDVGLFLFKINENLKNRINVHEKSSGPGTVPAESGKSLNSENRNLLAQSCYCCKE